MRRRAGVPPESSLKFELNRKKTKLKMPYHFPNLMCTRPCYILFVPHTVAVPLQFPYSTPTVAVAVGLWAESREPLSPGPGSLQDGFPGLPCKRGCEAGMRWGRHEIGRPNWLFNMQSLFTQAFWSPARKVDFHSKRSFGPRGCNVSRRRGNH